MNIDSIAFSAIVKEFQNFLPGAVLQKIYQPFKESLLLFVYGQHKETGIYLSLEKNNSFISIVRENPNPGIPASGFVMLLRKYIEGGRIEKVSQPPLERLMELEISSRGGGFFLVIELPGRWNNIFLLDSERKILGYLQKPSESGERLLAVNSLYIKPELPESKILPSLEKEDFFALLSSKADSNISAVFSRDFFGLPPLYAREILADAGISGDTLPGILSKTGLENLWNSWNKFWNYINSGNFQPVLYFGENEKPLCFSVFPLKEFSDNASRKFNSISELLASFAELSRHSLTDDLKTQLGKLLKQLLKKENARLTAQKNELEKASRYEDFKKIGDLILTNLHKIKSGEPEVELENFETDPPSIVRATLDPVLSPKENASKYYEKYKKAKRTTDILQQRVKTTEKQKLAFEEILASIEKATEENELEEIQKKLAKMGYLTVKESPKAKSSPSKPEPFARMNEYEIWVGKNNRQNDYITFQIAKPDDLWFHARGTPGAHVLLCRKHPSKPVPDFLIQKTAEITAAHSRSKNSSKVEVSYTLAKNVRKPKGAKPGMVIISEEKTILVKPVITEIAEK
ncbi:MAG: NFACT family protein [Firmicutes bacterium]|nr:NFACT family protein [Bacillota bacterium]